ncbi:hypothetical protein BGZ95_009856 [Linnemannia exigua]|uniref:F-box domain-containing protein n=1 Tax=Linnemannia exigua TaxID=604196 RepID=A0AAD4H6F3_9FUNG|nr:hypothetical protein BGZ95_009856 [Linnemannia exigua]
MESAFTRLFRIHELICLITSHLAKKDISHLMRTSRQMVTALEPSFYHELKTHYKPNTVNLWESPEGLKALARNMHFVKTWRSDLLFIVYYYHALVDFDSINNTLSSTLPKRTTSRRTDHSPTGDVCQQQQLLVDCCCQVGDRVSQS